MATILILDEEVDSRMLLKRLLERNAHHVWAFANPDGALECAATKSLDLALVNVTSRRGEAPALLKELKRVNPGLKVIVIAHFVSPETGDGISADCFLVKPMDIDSVEKKVRELLHHPSPDLGSGNMINRNTTG